MIVVWLEIHGAKRTFSIHLSLFAKLVIFRFIRIVKEGKLYILLYP
jgi:hypothetical protein